MEDGNATPDEWVEEATMDFAMGEIASALDKLSRAAEVDPDHFPTHHARAEICFSERRLDEALEAAEKAVALLPEDIHIHTTLSRIWMEKGDKEKAEQFGARARMLGWKETLKEPPPGEGPPPGSEGSREF